MEKILKLKYCNTLELRISLLKEEKKNIFCIYCFEIVRIEEKLCIQVIISRDFSSVKTWICCSLPKTVS